MSGAMLHGLGDCTPVLNCGCIGTGDARRPPSRAVIEAVEQAMRERLNLQGPMRHIFGDEVGDALKVLLAQEVQAAAPEDARAAEEAAREVSPWT